MLTSLKIIMGLSKKPFTAENYLKAKTKKQLSRLDETQRLSMFEDAFMKQSIDVVLRGLNDYGDDEKFQQLFIKHNMMDFLVKHRGLAQLDIHPSKFFLESLITYPTKDETIVTKLLLTLERHVSHIFTYGLQHLLSKKQIIQLSCNNSYHFNVFEEHGMVDSDVAKAYIYNIRNRVLDNTLTMYFYNKPYATFGVTQKKYPLSKEELISFQDEFIRFFNIVLRIYYDEHEDDYTIHHRRRDFFYKYQYSIQNIMGWIEQMDINVIFEELYEQDLNDNRFLHGFMALFDHDITLSVDKNELCIAFGDVTITNTHAVTILIKNMTVDFYMKKVLNTPIHELLSNRYPEFIALSLFSNMSDIHQRVGDMISIQDQSVDIPEIDIHI